MGRKEATLFCEGPHPPVPAALRPCALRLWLPALAPHRPQLPPPFPAGAVAMQMLFPANHASFEGPRGLTKLIYPQLAPLGC